MNRIDRIKQQLQQALNPFLLEIIDDSQQHIGHPGNTGGGHYTVNIGSVQFNGLTKIACHRLVYQAVTDMMPSEIHALSINIIDTEE